MPLDLLLTNATVLTMDEGRPVAEAVGIEGGRIAWVGTIEDARAHLTGVRRELDLGGGDHRSGIQRRAQSSHSPRALVVPA